MFKVIIAGSRGFSNYDLLKSKMDYFLSNMTDKIQIVSGTARGADQLGERYANEKGYSIQRFPADWEHEGKSAGYKRNVKMAEYADALVAFWNGSSRGTKHMIDIAQSHKLRIRVVYYDEDEPLLF